ncbi:MAG TPA: CorA family divalent cation transporter [Rhizomicrobium sp.]
MDQILKRSPGLLWGLAFADGKGARLTEENYDDSIAEPHDWVWMHFALSDHRARRFLESFEPMPQPARKFLLSVETRPQLHLAPDCAYGILPDIERDFEGVELGLGFILFWVDAKHLITTRHHPMRVAGDVRDDVEEGLLLATPTAALLKLQERFVEIVELRLVAIAHALDSFEDALLAGREDLGEDVLGPMRLEVSRYHRTFLALRNALHRAMNAKGGGGSENPVWPYLPQLMQDAEDFERDAAAAQERARLLYEELETRMAAVTNRSLRTLTILSTLILPATFVVGAFGMNLPNIPWANTHGGFWWATGLCFVVVGACYAALKRYRIL